MSHPIKVLHLESCPYPDSLRIDRGSSRFNSSEECSGLNMVWMTNKATFLARSTQNRSSMVMAMMSLMNPSIEASFDYIFNASWSAWTIGYEGYR